MVMLMQLPSVSWLVVPVPDLDSQTWTRTRTHELEHGRGIRGPHPSKGISKFLHAPRWGRTSVNASVFT
jgi:hypothetical protein